MIFVVFLLIYPIFSKCEFKFNILIFVIIPPSKNWSWPTGATIKENRVFRTTGYEELISSEVFKMTSMKQYYLPLCLFVSLSVL